MTLIRPLLACLLLPLASLIAPAASAAITQDDLLPVDEAFVLTATAPAEYPVRLSSFSFPQSEVSHADPCERSGGAGCGHPARVFIIMELRRGWSGDGLALSRDFTTARIDSRNFLVLNERRTALFPRPHRRGPVEARTESPEATEARVISAPSQARPR